MGNIVLRNGGKIKPGIQCLDRVQIETFGNQGGRYYPIAKFNYPYTEQGANGAKIEIFGTLGGYDNNSTLYISGCIGNRSGESGHFAMSGSTSWWNVLNACTLILYRNSDDTSTLYFYSIVEWRKCDLNIQWFPENQVTFLFDGSYTTSPSGTAVSSLYDWTPQMYIRPDKYHSWVNMTSSDWTWTNDTGRPVFVQANVQVYGQHAQAYVNDSEFWSSDPLTNGERSLANFTVFLARGDRLHVKGFNTDRYSVNGLHIVAYSMC